VASAGWEAFRGQLPPEPTAPRVSLRQDRRLSLNQAAYDLLGCPTEVVLLYSAARRAIGIRVTPENIGRRFHVRQEGDAARYVIESAPFIRYYRIDYSQLTVFETVQFEDGMLVLSLDQARRRRRGPIPYGE
jgi:hypothetical protein